MPSIDTNYPTQPPILLFYDFILFHCKNENYFNSQSYAKLPEADMYDKMQFQIKIHASRNLKNIKFLLREILVNLILFKTNLDTYP